MRPKLFIHTVQNVEIGWKIGGSRNIAISKMEHSCRDKLA